MELFLGAIFVLVMVVELVSGGANLPNQPSPIPSGFVEVLFGPNWHLIRIYTFHVTLFTWLLTACLVRVENLPLPKKLTAFGGFVGAAMPLVWLDIYPLLAWETDDRTTLVIGATSFVGVTIGFVCGYILFKSFREWFSENDLESLLVIGAIMGLFLGWQGVVGATTIAILLIWIAPMFMNHTLFARTPLAFWWSIGCLCQVCLWKWVDGLTVFPSQEFSWLGLLAPFTVIAVTLIATRVVTLPGQFVDTGNDDAADEVQND